MLCWCHQQQHQALNAMLLCSGLPRVVLLRSQRKLQWQREGVFLLLQCQWTMHCQRLVSRVWLWRRLCNSRSACAPHCDSMLMCCHYSWQSSQPLVACAPDVCCNMHHMTRMCALLAEDCVQSMQNKDAFCNGGVSCGYGRGPGQYNCACNGKSQFHHSATEQAQLKKEVCCFCNAQ